MTPPSIPDNDQERLASLRRLGLLDTPPEERFDAITRLATMIFETPISYLSLVDETRQFLKSRIGLNFCESDRATSFCGHAILENEPLVIADTMKDERFADNPQVTGEPFARFYCGLPLRGPEGLNVGTLCLMDTKPREFSEQDIVKIKQLGFLAERELQLGDMIRMQDDLIQTKDALIESQRMVAQQMDEALSYVISLLPQDLNDKVRTSYQFIPSSTLGGDSFGFHWLDEDHLAIYLLDVCGHGVGSALLSVSAMNVLRTQTLPETDFMEPAQVLSALNKAFPMEEKHGMFFTIWYGVLEVSSGRLRYSGAGHPPAVIVEKAGGVNQLNAQGIPVGCFENFEYETQETVFPQGSHLYVFSDGIYEVQNPDKTMGTYDDFLLRLQGAPSAESLIESVRNHQQQQHFEDDVSVIRIGRPD